MTFTINASLQNKRLHKLICTFLLSRNYFNMGIREEEVEVDWDVRSKIFQDCFLLTEIMQTFFIIVFNFRFPQLSLSVPFREDSHSSCAQDVQWCFLMLIFGNVLSCKAQQWVNIITGFLWCFSQFRNTYRENFAWLRKIYKLYIILGHHLIILKHLNEPKCLFTLPGLIFMTTGLRC